MPTERTDEEIARRIVACVKACEGLPTRALELGLVPSIYALCAAVALADHMTTPADGYLKIPANWWRAHFREPFDKLNRMCADAAKEGKDGINQYADVDFKAALRTARAQGVSEEREACAKVAERHVPSSPSAGGEHAMRRNGEDIAAAIRSRSTDRPGEA